MPEIFETRSAGDIVRGNIYQNRSQQILVLSVDEWTLKDGKKNSKVHRWTCYVDQEMNVGDALFGQFLEFVRDPETKFLGCIPQKADKFDLWLLKMAAKRKTC